MYALADMGREEDSRFLPSVRPRRLTDQRMLSRAELL